MAGKTTRSIDVGWPSITPGRGVGRLVAGKDYQLNLQRSTKSYLDVDQGTGLSRAAHALFSGPGGVTILDSMRTDPPDLASIKPARRSSPRWTRRCASCLHTSSHTKQRLLDEASPPGLLHRLFLVCVLSCDAFVVQCVSPRQVFRRRTFKAFAALFDNYNAAVGKVTA